MAQQHFLANRGIEMVLLALQAFQVLFLWVHDWIPLGRLNDVAAVRSQDTRRRLVTVTLIQSVPWTIGLCLSLVHFRRPYPGWLYDWLVISYCMVRRTTARGNVREKSSLRKCIRPVVGDFLRP